MNQTTKHSDQGSKNLGNRSDSKSDTKKMSGGDRSHTENPERKQNTKKNTTELDEELEDEHLNKNV